jgi:hypothetical protein
VRSIRDVPSESKAGDGESRCVRRDVIPLIPGLSPRIVLCTPPQELRSVDEL